MNRRPADPLGFTLVELLVGLAGLVILTAATTASLSSLWRARESAEGRHNALTRADTAARAIAADLRAAARDYDLTATRVRITDGGRDGSDSLLLVARTARRVRAEAGTPEGGDFEIQYRVGPDEGPSPTALWRRADPGLDDAIDGGGIATPVVPGVVRLEFGAIDSADGAEWLGSWDSDSDGMPHAVRIIVQAADDQTGRTEIARRIVALDRTPAPTAQEDPEADEDDGSATTGAGPATGSSGGQPASTGGGTPTNAPTGGAPTGGGGGGGARP